MEIEMPSKTFKLINDDIIVDLKIEIPKKIYKYVSINKYSVENLQQNKIHFSHPFKLNDLMEGNAQLWDLDEYINSYHEKTRNPKEQIFKILTQDFLEDVFTHRGVLCLTTEYNNNLFWPHYTNEQGVCIEFNNSFLDSFDNLDYKIFPIDYGILERINFNEYITTTEVKREESVARDQVNANLPIFYTLSLKEKIWEYEKEWRIVLAKDNLGKISHPLKIIDDDSFSSEKKQLINRNLPYNRESIDKIILSTLFFNHNRFNKVEKEKEKLKFYFKEDDEPLYNFLLELKNIYADKVYQIDRTIENNSSITSKLSCKIEILDISKSYIIINRVFIDAL